jgi:hypothetical protein
VRAGLKVQTCDFNNYKGAEFLVGTTGAKPEALGMLRMFLTEDTVKGIVRPIFN